MTVSGSSTDEFIGYLASIAQQPLPESATLKTKQHLLDYIGVACAGAHANRRVFQSFASEYPGPCTVLGYGVRASGCEAAFINAYNAHALEMDDGSRFGMIHLGAAIISAVIAAAQQHSVSYGHVLKGIAVGYEAAVRVAKAIQPGHKKRGFHATGTCGTIGAAMGAGIVYGLTQEQLKTALSAAATSSAGLLEIQEDPSVLKPYNAGHAAMAGLHAASFGMTGLQGPSDILLGERGMLRLFGADCSQDKLLEKSDELEIERAYIKPYASCRHCHPAVEAVIQLRAQVHFSPSSIQEIQVKTYELAVKGHNHAAAPNAQVAKLSIPYSVASAYVLGAAGIEAFSEESLHNTEILELAEKVSVIPDPGKTALQGEKRSAEVVLKTQQSCVSHAVEDAKGEPENPMSEEELVEKFREAMIWAGMGKHCDNVLRRIIDGEG